MDDAIVSFEELKKLSGYKLAKSICKWLEANNIPHLKNANGRPIVSSAVFLHALGESTTPQVTPEPVRSINLSAMDRITTR